MSLLKQCLGTSQVISHSTLHSTMSLLKLKVVTVHGGHNPPLHSTMSLLKHGTKITNYSKPIYTLHSTMSLLKLLSFGDYETVTNLYIPLCLY